MSSFFDYLSSSAVSLTVAGNTGISPFLTLFLMAIVEISDPTLLNMDGTIESILTSWYSMGILGVLTLLEFVGKCVPVIDSAIDSVEVFVVPIISVFGSLGTFGLLDMLADATTTTTTTEQGEGRQLSAGDSVLTGTKVFLCLVGVGLSLAIHLFKMLVRLTGLVCCGGCCQPCITIVEVTCVVSGVLFAIFIQEIAIVIAIVLFLAAGYAVKQTFFSEKQDVQNTHGQIPPSTNAAPQNLTTMTTTAAAATNTTNIPGVSCIQTKPDIENPVPTPFFPASSTLQPSAPMESSELTEVPPPPAMNPNYLASDLKDVVPIAVAERVE
jgi:Domain of unknown function (DUF4126)